MPRNVKSHRLNVRISEATVSQLDWLIREAQFTNRTSIIETAIDRMFQQERSNMHAKNRPIVLAAQLIGGYVGPQWLVEPIGEPSDDDDLAAINASDVYVMDRHISGWGEYNAVIRVAKESVPALGTYYLARLA